jgi:UDP-2,4-diacetamido-2,4,6-trideoxy-beta-L-altropyranose hydrolase
MIKVDNIVIRKADKNDCRAIYEMRSHPEIVKNSLQQQPIEYDSHKQWYDQKLSCVDTILLIAMSAGQVVGSIRLERLYPDRARIAINIMPEHQGLRIGTKLLNEGQILLRNDWPEVQIIEAEILSDNKPSKSFFEKAGFFHVSCIYTKGLKDVD